MKSKSKKIKTRGESLPLAHTSLFATPSSGDTPQRPVICVTGKMASGKNYICSQLEKDGWASVDADLLVHKAIEQKKEIILKTFEVEAQNLNAHLQNPDGTINRRELGKVVFSNPELLARQESIVYPAITQMIKDFIQEHPKTIINATVLYKTPELLNLCQYILFVKANGLKRLIRARKRDNLPYKQIFRRFIAQKNLYKLYKNTGKTVLIIKN